MKTIFFGLLKRQRIFYTKIVQATLQKIIRAHIDLVSVIHSDGWPGYNGLVEIVFDKHFRVNHGASEFAACERHINWIESFWRYAKRRMAKFNGLTKRTFNLHLKETEFRFNHCGDNLYLVTLKLLHLNPL